MDRLRTLVLARTHTVVMDPDRAASAATRPLRDADADRLEDELADLGYVMSLDLAMTIRRLPREANRELHAWLVETLTPGARRAVLPLPATAATSHLRRMLGWLATSPTQPCPWCGEIKVVGALDPCGHLVCKTCWEGGGFGACPVCHRRISPQAPFVHGARANARASTLVLLHLGFDLVGTVRERFRSLLGATTRLSAAERAEVELVIDTLGAKALTWLPEHIPVRPTMAIALARLWLVAPERAAIPAATAAHVVTATDVLRVAAVVMGASPELERPFVLCSPPRRLRRALLACLDRLPVAANAEEVVRRGALWKRVGERLHPFELAERLPNAALVFAIARRGDLPACLRDRVPATTSGSDAVLRLARGRVRVQAAAAPVEAALGAGDARTAALQLADRPDELLRRADHIVRVALARQPHALPEVLAALERAIKRGAPAALLVLGSHVARRGTAWPQRVAVPHGDALAAWRYDDRRLALRADVRTAIAGAVRAELVARAATGRHFPRAVIDRALGDAPMPLHGAHGWPRGSVLALPAGHELRIARASGDLGVGPLAAESFDSVWRHVASASTSGVELALHLEELHVAGARHVVIAASSDDGTRLEVAAPGGGAIALALRRARLAIALAIDLPARQLTWLDIAVADRGRLARAGGYRAALAHVARDLGDLAAAHARPTLWDVACIHAATRANIVYVRERDGAITTYRRRDGEPPLARLARLLSGGGEDGKAAALPAANAPTWFALVHGELALPVGSVGYIVDGAVAGVERVTAAELVAGLAR